MTIERKGYGVVPVYKGLIDSHAAPGAVGGMLMHASAAAAQRMVSSGQARWAFPPCIDFPGALILPLPAKPIASIKGLVWQRYGHACGITGRYAPVGRARAKALAGAYGAGIVPRVGYCVDLSDGAERYILTNSGGRFEVQAMGAVRR